MLNSMTGFASGKGAEGAFSWTWEIRAVNGKGLDLRFRVPDWVQGLEAALRTRLAQAMARGNVSVSLRLQRHDSTAAASLDGNMLDAVLLAMAEIESRAMEQGLSLAPANAADVVAVRGVFEAAPEQPEDTAHLLKAVMADFEPLIASMAEMRQSEGEALEKVLRHQLKRIAELTEEADRTVQARKPEIETQFRTALGRVMEASNTVDEARVAQELAILAVKSDVTEEIDRLRAHVTAARDLIDIGSPVGRKLDFLSQEFNREANTLCSKAQNAALSAVGLELKTVIDQMREQVQNVE